MAPGAVIALNLDPERESFPMVMGSHGFGHRQFLIIKNLSLYCCMFANRRISL